MKLFGIQDVKADAMMNVFMMSTRAQAVRGFSDLVHDEKTDVFRHPEDYRLMYLGDMDQSTGVITALASPESLGFGTEWK